MIKLRSLLLEIFLGENRKDDFEKKYGNLPVHVLNYIIKNDPSDNYKYLDWVGKIMTNETGHNPVEIMELIKQFHKKLKDKDIYSIKSVSELIDVIKKVPVSKGEQLEKDTDLIYQDARWLIVSPKTHNSCRHYGGGTRWCIATSNENHWTNYFYDNSIVIVKDRSNDTEYDLTKVAILSPYNESSMNQWTFYNSSDHTIRGQEKKEYYLQLPDEARDAIEHHMEYDDLEERKNELQQKREDEYWENNGLDGMMDDLSDKIKKEWHIDIDKDELKNSLIKIIGETETEYLFREIFRYAIGDHGWQDPGYYIQDLKQFIEYADEAGNNIYFNNILLQVTRRKRNIDYALEIVKSSLPENIYDLLYIDMDLDKSLINAYDKYMTRMNDPRQQTFSGIDKTVEYPRINNIQDIIQILELGGYHQESHMIKNNLTVKEEKNIKLKSLVRKKY